MVERKSQKIASNLPDEGLSHLPDDPLHRLPHQILRELVNGLPDELLDDLLDRLPDGTLRGLLGTMLDHIPAGLLAELLDRLPTQLLDGLGHGLPPWLRNDPRTWLLAELRRHQQEMLPDWLRAWLEAWLTDAIWDELREELRAWLRDELRAWVRDQLPHWLRNDLPYWLRDELRTWLQDGLPGQPPAGLRAWLENELKKNAHEWDRLSEEFWPELPAWDTPKQQIESTAAQSPSEVEGLRLRTARVAELWARFGFFLPPRSKKLLEYDLAEHTSDLYAMLVEAGRRSKQDRLILRFTIAAVGKVLACSCVAIRRRLRDEFQWVARQLPPK